MNYQRAKKSDIFKYSFGGVGSNIAFIIAMSYLTFFYTDILGIPASAIAGIMLAARIVDAVTDPLMGMIADHTKCKMGRYRPWIIFAAPIMGITIWMMFSSPNLSPTGKVAWAYTTYIAFSIFSTIANIPYHSLTPVMSEDPNQRTVIAVSKQAMSIPAQLLVAVMGLPLVNAFGGGAKGWSTYGAFCGILATLAFWMCAWGAKKYDTMELVRKQERIPIKQQMKLIYSNRPLLMLMIAFGTDLIASAATSAVNVHYFVYVLGRKDLVSVIALANMGLSLLIFALIPVLAKRIGKKPLYLISTFMCLIPLLILYFLPNANLGFIITMLIVSGMFTMMPGNLGWAMLPDCVEYGEWKLGIRGEGTVTSSLTFVNKLGMAIGGALAGMMLASSGFVANQVQTAEAIQAIRFMKFIFPVMGYICSLVSMYFYDITNKKYAQIMDELRERHQEKAEN